MHTFEQVVERRWVGIFEPTGDKLDRLTAWFEAERVGLTRFAYFVCGNADLAQDLVQDAFVRLYRSAGRIEDATVGAYARKTILNLSRSRFRGRAREHRVVQTPRAAPPYDPSERDRVWRALLQLSPRQRAVMALRYYEDLSERQIADVLGMSAGSVKTHADRATGRLRELLGGDER